MDLGKDFNYKTIDFPDDYEGKVISTLISAKANKGNRSSVLYIHGFIDYFFHPHVAQEFLEKGYDFYALDLRKYGNSLLDHQHPNYCKSMDEYFEEVSLAIREVYKASDEKIILLGHSTGGLLSSYYMNYGAEKDSVGALVLNSPFLDLNVPVITKILTPSVSRIMSVIAPYSKIDGILSPAYAKSLHKDYYGEWDFNLKWKPIDGFPVFYAWSRAITRAQSFLKKSSDINIPVLVMHSDKSFRTKKYIKEVQTADTVLNVKDIKDIGARLGEKVTLVKVDDAMHDIFLSKAEVRAFAFNEMFKWLDRI